MTRAPRRRNSAAYRPGPHPASSTVRPVTGSASRSTASRSTTGGSGMGVIGSSGSGHRVPRRRCVLPGEVRSTRVPMAEPLYSPVISRVAPAHCCAEAPSEPGLAAFTASGSSKSCGLAGSQKCGGGVVADVVSSLTGHVCETTAKGIRRATDRCDRGADRFAGGPQPVFPLARALPYCQRSSTKRTTPSAT